MTSLPYTICLVLILSSSFAWSGSTADDVRKPFQSDPAKAKNGAMAPKARPLVLPLTLESSIRMALERNFAIEIQRYEPLIAQQEIRRALGRFDPTLSLNLNRTEDDRVSGADLLTGQPRFSFNRIDRSGVGLGGVTPWGLDYDLGLNVRRSSGANPEIFSGEARLALTQPLLRGFGPDANLAAVRIARNNAGVSEWGLRSRIIEIMTTTHEVYNELHFANENYKVAVRSRERAQQLLKDNQRRAEVGVMSPLSVTTARAEVAAREEAVIVADRRIKDLENLLKQLITGDIETMLDTRVVIEPPTAPVIRADVRLGIKAALELRPDYQQALLTMKNRNITVAFAKNDALPRLDLTASLSLLGLSNNFGDAIGRIQHRDESQWSAGATFSLPLPNREGKARLEIAKIEAAQYLVELQQLEQRIIVEVDTSAGRITTARKRIESTEISTKLAQESLDAGVERLTAGTGTTFEVVELQERLAEAEARELRARADYNQSVAGFRQITGTMMEFHHVKVN